MGTSLYGLTPSGTYPGLIKTGDNTAISGTLKTLSDGSGNNLPMEASTSTINFTGALQQSGVAVPTASQVNAKQDTLVSGTNIKTINGTSVLGSGNIVTPSTSPSGSAGYIQFSNGSAFASDANFFWDNTNKRLGIGTTSPTQSLEVLGNTLINANAGSDATLSVGNPSRRWDIKAIQSGAYYQVSYQTTGLIGQSMDYQGNVAFGDFAQATARVHIKGSGSTSATTSLLVQNSSGTEMLRVRDDNKVIINEIMNSGFSYYGVQPSFYIPQSISGFQRMVWFHSWEFGGSSSTPTGLTISGAVNQSGTAGFKAISLNITQTAIGSGEKQLIDLQYNSTRQFNVDYLGNLGVGVTSQNASAKMQVDSTTQGFLPPRMTTTQKNAISSPASGLVVYDTTTNKLCCYNGTSWNDLF